MHRKVFEHESTLPLLTPEYQAGLREFSRRYFRELFERLPDGSALVLDNYHEIAPDAACRDAVSNCGSAWRESRRRSPAR